MDEQVKLLVAYDIRPGYESAYRRFIQEEFLPQAQELGLTPSDAWHTAYGNYPLRLLGFIADDLEAVQAVRQTPQWQYLIQRLESLTMNLQQKVVPLRGGFQW
ncbi:MAG: hypothetical protein ACP5UQ_07480 [Anaerolineae bacterium]